MRAQDFLAHLNYTKDYSPSAGWQIRERGVKAQIVCRRASCLGSFLQVGPGTASRSAIRPTWLTSRSCHIASRCGWRRRSRRPCGRPRGAWTISSRTSFGRTREHIVRRRYDFFFWLILNAGLRITEALGPGRAGGGWDCLDRCASSARETGSAWSRSPRTSARCSGSS
jgi:hypothetical protein